MLHKLFGTTLRAENVVEQMQTLVPGVPGRAENVYRDIVAHIKHDAVPNIKISTRQVKPEAGGLTNEKQQFLVIENMKLKNFDTYINVRDYGNQLLVSWYVIREKPGLKLAFKRAPFRTLILLPFILIANILTFFINILSHLSPGFSKGAALFGGASPIGFIEGLNLFDQQELNAYVTTVHEATKLSVEHLTRGINYDFSKIKMRSRGFLNLS